MIGNKADLIDAEKLAQLHRLDAIREAWQHSAEQSNLKELVRTHENLISDCIKVMNRIKTIYRSQAIKLSVRPFIKPRNMMNGWRNYFLKANGSGPNLGFSSGNYYLAFLGTPSNTDIWHIKPCRLTLPDARRQRVSLIQN